MSKSHSNPWTFRIPRVFDGCGLVKIPTCSLGLFGYFTITGSQLRSWRNVGLAPSASPVCTTKPQSSSSSSYRGLRDARGEDTAWRSEQVHVDQRSNSEIESHHYYILLYILVANIAGIVIVIVNDWHQPVQTWSHLIILFLHILTDWNLECRLERSLDLNWARQHQLNLFLMSFPTVFSLRMPPLKWAFFIETTAVRMLAEPMPLLALLTEIYQVKWFCGKKHVYSNMFMIYDCSFYDCSLIH